MWRIVSTACLPWSSSARRFFSGATRRRRPSFFSFSASHACAYTPSLSSTERRASLV
ncbi:hypothetical protein PR003_g29097 [Phytophthora rubi]|uniref:Uncharacterized protein n=1 Tax=Phytophthora rubi TaxID=129364 RepID=A0A6A4BK92_9STRA|nr:hypothetical protein PR002_g29331 [Phytophthora rubi]KAE8963748.1 hypothetical protein PR001_g29277 [Phytophthora rubi]KAE9276317.1 hypothetical protein PR003_g29097 [Phytophthora rubi]